MSVPAVGAEEHGLSSPTGMRGTCMCVCTRVCARGVLFNVYISTIYTPRSWGPYIYSIPCLGSVSSRGQNDLAGGTEAPFGWLRCPSPVGRAGPTPDLCRDRQAVWGGEVARLLLAQSQHGLPCCVSKAAVQNPKDFLGFAESKPSLQAICLSGAGCALSRRRRAQGRSVVLCASLH